MTAEITRVECDQSSRSLPIENLSRTTSVSQSVIRSTKALLAILLIACLSPSGKATCQQIQIRELSVPVASGQFALGSGVSIRELSNGTILINDFLNGRVLSVDSCLRQAVTVVDSTILKRPRLGFVASTLIPYLQDSTIIADIAGNTLLMLGPKGEFVRVVALPRPSDLSFLSNATVYGNPSSDRQGRLIHRGEIATRRVGANVLDARSPSASTSPRSDSAAVVRTDLDARIVDTLFFFKELRSSRSSSSSLGDITVNTRKLDPLASGDQWVVLKDESIAVLRASDYHVDWRDSSGRWTSLVKMPFPWRRVSEERKQAMADSIRSRYAAINAQLNRGGFSSRFLQRFEPVSPDEMSDYEPSVRANSLFADFAGRLWILPRSSSDARGGLLYDVMSRSGTVDFRVQFPADTKLVGFGAHSLYALRVEGARSFLIRTSVP